MKRVVVAAIMVAAVGLIGFDAPARGLTNYAATMVGPAFKFSKGVCGTSSGDGSFNIVVGDSITWTNCTQAEHTVTGQGFGDTSHISPQGTFSHTFNTPGTFPYHCDIHPSMTGSVNVAGEATTVPATTQPPTTATPATTAKPAATTTSSTAKPAATTSTVDIFDLGEEPESSTTSTTSDPTVTTRALGSGGESGTSAGLVAALIVGLGAVATAGALVIRRMRGGPPIPPS